MTFIQHSLMEPHQVSLVSPVKQSDNNDGFEEILDAVVLKEAAPIAPQPLDLNNLTLESDICVVEQQLPMHAIDVIMRETADSEQIQGSPVSLKPEHFQKETSLGIPALKKIGLKKLETDGTEVDASMMIPVVPIEALPNPVTLTHFEIKRGGESLHSESNESDSKTSNINLATIDFSAINPTYIKVDPKEDVMVDTKDNPTTVLRDLNELKKAETTLPLSVSKEVVSNAQTTVLMPTAETVSHMMDKSMATVTIKTRWSEIQSNDDTLMAEAPIVSIALKRDPVMQSIPVKTSAVDVASKDESVTLDQPAVSKPNISNEVAEVAKLTEPEKESFESDFEEVKPLLETSAKEAVIKPMQSGAASESSEVSTEVNISKSAPTQQIQQAILDAKEGVSPKESKTLTVVLNPEELGVVNVELRSDETGKLHAVLSVEKRETLDVLQHDLHQLKTVLKEIGIDESSISLQLSSNNEHGQQKQSEYVAWEEREQMLARSSQTSIKTNTVEKATYPERQSTRRLDIKA